MEKEILMKFLKGLFFVFCCLFVGAVNAADITLFYSPTCPHCHHARDFISTALIYEYNDLKVSEVNVTNIDNRQAFVDALFKCKYQSGGVPVIVIGEKCFQGYANSMQDALREAIEIDLSDEQKSAAAANKAEMAKDKDAFVAAHEDRKSAISELEPQKKSK
jgi:glutaredoxin